MKKITNTTAVGSLRKLADENREAQYIIDAIYPSVFGDAAEDCTLEALAGTQVKNVVSALNYSLRILETTGQVTYRLYTEEERRQRPEHSRSTVLFYPGRPESPVIIVVPGGGYGVVATVDEGVPICMTLNTMGYNAISLNYSVNVENVLVHALEDMARTVALLTDDRNKLGLLNKHYAVAGFSAGGHLGGLWCTKKFGYEKFGLPKPDVLLEAYPLIQVERNYVSYKPGMRLPPEIARRERGPEMVSGLETIEQYSVDKSIDPSFPPTFIVHGKLDEKVYCRQSVSMAEALGKHGVRHVLKLYDGTDHAFGDGKGTPAEGWLNEAMDFWMNDSK